jgi:hypothetical protein
MFTRGWGTQAVGTLLLLSISRFGKLRIPPLNTQQKRLRFKIGNWRYAILVIYVLYWACRHSNPAAWCLTALGLLVLFAFHCAAWLELQEDLKKTGEGSIAPIANANQSGLVKRG